MAMDEISKRGNYVKAEQQVLNNANASTPNNRFKLTEVEHAGIGNGDITNSFVDRPEFCTGLATGANYSVDPEMAADGISLVVNEDHEEHADGTDIGSQLIKITERKHRSACGEKCHQCCKRIRLPRWLKHILQFVYRWTSDPITYAILFALVYMTISSLQPDMAQLPECRHIAVPMASISSGLASNETDNPFIAGTDAMIPSGYILGLECRRGDAFSVLIMYVFGFYIGQIMELIHLPGLLGMILGGLTLRNIGAAIAPYRIYHAGATPNASVPLATLLGFQGEAPFNATEPLTQFAALLSVNPNLSAVLRQLVLATILTRAGLGIDPKTLKRVCGSVLRLTFLPCLTEAAVLTVISHFLIGWPWIWGAVLGFVIAAVSPSVVVPIMMRLEATGWGVAAGIPTLVVAASSLDDVLAITGFSVCLAVALSTGTNLVATVFWGPGQALIGVVFGAGVGSLLGLYPPAGLEHSHTIRFMFVACLAAIGLLGSMRIQLPGAGALACLLSAFTIASVWRAGYPWKLLPIDEADETGTSASSANGTDVNTACSRDDVSEGAGRGGGGGEQGGTLAVWTSPHLNHRTDYEKQTEVFSDEYPSDIEADSNQSTVNRSVPSSNVRKIQNRKRLHQESVSSNILDTVIEHHPYNYASTRPPPSSNPMNVYATPRPDDSYQSTANNAPNASALVAAVDGYELGDRSYVLQRSTSTRSRPRRFRRFSLPEPTAPYDLESFSMSGAVRVIPVSESTRSSERKTHGVRRRIVTSAAYGEQYSATRDQPTDKLEKVKETELEHIGAKVVTTDRGSGTDTNASQIVDSKMNGTFPDKPKQSPAMHPTHSIADGDIIAWPATSEERGEACLNLIRQTFASVWWFVQPILFTLIGAEVDLTIIKGSTVGFGVASLCIGIVLRMLASLVAVWPSKLNMKERVFISFSWLPKATVQAAIGPVALDTARQLNAPTQIIGYAELVLVLAATAILMTAPVGAVLMRVTAPCLLVRDTSVELEKPGETRKPNVKTNRKPIDRAPTNQNTSENITTAQTFDERG